MLKPILKGEEISGFDSSKRQLHLVTSFDLNWQLTHNVRKIIVPEELISTSNYINMYVAITLSVKRVDVAMGQALAVEVKDLHKIYHLKGEEIHALRGINLEIPHGEYLSVMGPSGCGKTTLFNMIGGIDAPTKGTILIDGVDLSRLSSKSLAWLRCRKIGYIFQTFNLIPVLTAQENVALPMIFLGVPKEERRKRAVELLETVGLGDRVDHRPNELSGGQQQRVAIARALANDPAIILADEPTGNLDLNTGFAIVQLLYRLKVERGTTIICATHDLKMIDVSDRVVFIRDGEIENVERRRGLTLTAEEFKSMS